MAGGWPELRRELVERFEAFPGELDERTVVAAFEAAPAAVRASASRIAEGVRVGRIRNGWRVLALDVAAPASSSRRGEELAGVVLERRLRGWVRAEGMHYPRDVVLLELERRGAGDELRARLLTEWSRLAGASSERHEADGTRRKHGGGADPDRGGPSDASSSQKEVVL